MKKFLKHPKGFKIEELEDSYEIGENLDKKVKIRMDDTFKDKGSFEESLIMKGNYLLRVDIEKFDVVDIKIWMIQLEQYFMLHDL